MTATPRALPPFEGVDPVVAHAAERYADVVDSLIYRSEVGVGHWQLRQGRRVEQHVYLQHGPQASDDDEPLFTCPTSAMASLIVVAVNEHLTRTRGGHI